MHSQSDAMLIENYLDGDRTAISDLCERYYERIQREVQRKIWSRHQVKDITQDVCLKMMNKRNLKNIKKRDYIWPWLKSVVFNACLQYFREQSKLNIVYVGDYYENCFQGEYYHSVQQQFSPEQNLLGKQHTNSLLEVFSFLQEKERQVMISQIILDHSVEETSRLLHITKNYVSVLKTRGIDKLQKRKAEIFEKVSC